MGIVDAPSNETVENIYNINQRILSNLVSLTQIKELKQIATIITYKRVIISI
jgi:hypothetical protein